MALTRTPSGPKSTAICRVSPSTPALSDEYLPEDIHGQSREKHTGRGEGSGREVVAGGEQAVHRRDVDDATTARLLHLRHSVLRREEVGLDPHVERSVPAVFW